MDFSAFQGLLADADVVEGFDALAPGVDLGLIEVAGGGGVREEQRQRQSLIHVLGGLGVRVEALDMGMVNPAYVSTMAFQPIS